MRRLLGLVCVAAAFGQLGACSATAGGGPHGGSGGGSGGPDGGRAAGSGGGPGSGGVGSPGSGGSDGGNSTGGTGTGGSGQGGVGAGSGSQLGSGGSPAGGGASGGGGVHGDTGTGGRAGPGAGGMAGIGGQAGATNGGVAFSPERVILTAVRSVTSPRATTTVRIVNQGSAPAVLSSVTLSGTNASAFVLTGGDHPATLAPGAGADVTVELLTSGSGIPASPPQDSGAALVTATLTATFDGGTARASVYGLLLTQALWEPTLGQILTTLGYKLNVGLAQDNANPNRGKAVEQLPGVESGTDEIAAQRFVKAGAGDVTLSAVARFSPEGPLPLGWYPAGNGGMRTVVATMARATDAQTSNKARLVGPPLEAGSAAGFDPGSQAFGIWVYTDQLSMKYDSGTTAYGDYDYSEDALNAPAKVHRMKVYPLKDSTGAAIANSFLLAIEEAANGDYQDYVFVLGNAKVSP